MSEADVDNFIEKELDPGRIVEKLGDPKTHQLFIYVPDTCHSTGGLEGREEFSALHEKIRQHLRKLRSRHLHFEVLNYRNLVQTSIKHEGKTITKYKDEPSSVIIVCFGKNPYRYVMNYTFGIIFGLLASMFASAMLLLLFNPPQWVFLTALVAVFCGVGWSAAYLSRRRLRTFEPGQQHTSSE